MKNIIFTFLILSITTMCYGQSNKKGYIKYNLSIEKASYEMVSIEKIKAKFDYQLEVAWNKDWALQRKTIRGDTDVYFLHEQGEENINVYVHFLKDNKKVSFPIGEHFKKDFSMYPSLKDYTWKRTGNTRSIGNLSCVDYELVVAGYPHDTNVWCINEDMKNYFDFHPFYANETFGLPLEISTGSSIKQLYTIKESSKKPSEEILSFDKSAYESMSDESFKKKHPNLYHTIFEAI